MATFTPLNDFGSNFQFLSQLSAEGLKTDNGLQVEFSRPLINVHKIVNIQAAEKTERVLISDTKRVLNFTSIELYNPISEKQPDEDNLHPLYTAQAVKALFLNHKPVIRQMIEKNHLNRSNMITNLTNLKTTEMNKLKPESEGNYSSTVQEAFDTAIASITPDDEREDSILPQDQQYSKETPFLKEHHTKIPEGNFAQFFGGIKNYLESERRLANGFSTLDTQKLLGSNLGDTSIYFFFPEFENELNTLQTTVKIEGDKLFSSYRTSFGKELKVTDSLIGKYIKMQLDDETSPQKLAGLKKHILATATNKIFPLVKDAIGYRQLQHKLQAQIETEIQAQTETKLNSEAVTKNAAPKPKLDPEILEMQKQLKELSEKLESLA